MFFFAGAIVAIAAAVPGSGVEAVVVGWGVGRLVVGGFSEEEPNEERAEGGEAGRYDCDGGFGSGPDGDVGVVPWWMDVSF